MRDWKKGHKDVRFRALESSPATGKDHYRRVLTPGDQDMTSEAVVRRFWRRCRLALEAKPHTLAIDLSEVLRADTKLIACLAGLYQLGRDEQVCLEVHASAAVRTVARICQLEALLQSMAPTPAPTDSQPSAQPAAEIERLISKAL